MPEGFLADITVFSTAPGETMAWGERIGRLLPRGSVVALRGGLGAGKTCFAKGIARGLGVDEEITSPTYTIISEYEGSLPLYHIDAYRLAGDEDFCALGAEELLYGNGVSVIEWSERIPRSIPAGAVFVELEFAGEEKRKIRIRAPSLPPEILPVATLLSETLPPETLPPEMENP
ncbi:MAG: tRNA (adenosine(37)-N6)-threonylcarbamoyltransferase complex ATPase subunit type 1 TsaE [Spirochaetaceae bacterium]|nr:tRNA (adenosine(37)-N6)-threonylcarbamoyltransferase complex ATPase subunit type 1 TsaE [Spirochaetaceae bacterium]